MRTQNPHFVALGLLGQGVVWLRRGDFARCEQTLQRWLASLLVEMGPVPESVAQGLLARSALMQGQLILAEQRASATAATLRRSKWEMVDLRHGLGCVIEVCLELPHFDRHAATLNWALGRLRRLGRRFPLAGAQSCFYEARLALRNGQHRDAREGLLRALVRSEEHGQPYVNALAHFYVSKALLGPATGLAEWRQADAHLHAAERLFREIGIPWEVQRVEHARSQLRIRRPQRSEAACLALSRAA